MQALRIAPPRKFAGEPKLLLIAATAALFSMVSCKPEYHYYKGYSYKIEYNSLVSYRVMDEYNDVYAELCAAANYKPGQPYNDAPSPSDEAYAGFKQAIDRETQHDLYVECGQTYVAIKQAWADWLDKPENGSPAVTAFAWKDSEENTNWLIEGCNIIYDNNKDRKHPTDLTYTLTKTDFFDEKV